MGIDINIDTGDAEFNMCEALAGLVKDGLISLTEADKRANMTADEFEAKQA